MQTEETALNAIRKMGSYSTDENVPETPVSVGGTPNPRRGLTITHPIYSEKVAVVKLLDTAAFGVIGRKK